jgi:mannosylfructose-6-phosphate phosphatase
MIVHDFLLVSDVDYTLLGDDAALAAFAEWYADARRYLRLALSSGRFCDSILESVRTSGLPQPDAVIGGVGTMICIFPDGKPLADWPPAADNWDPRAIRKALTSFPQLEPQPAHLQSRFKISYYAYDLDEPSLEKLRRQLASAGQRADIVYSSQRDLDVLPAGANKGTAVAHLARHWRLDPTHVIVAGDSGNDLEMFRQGFLGIVVGNAHPELKSLRGANIYQASQDYAAGVLEGLRHWLAEKRQPRN